MSASGGSNFDVTVTDNVSAPTGNAARALKALKGQIDRETKSLNSMQAAMKRLQGASSVDVATFRKLNSQIEDSKNRIASLQEHGLALGGGFEDAAEAPKTLADSLSECKSPTQVLKTLFSAMPPQVQLLASTLLAVAGAALAMAAAVVGAAVAMSRLALASADARRSEMLQLEGLTTLRNYYGIAAGSASDLVAAIDRVSDSSAQSRGEISSMAQGLYRAGLRGANLEDALEGLSIAQSVQGDRGGARFRALAVSIARTGGSVRRLTDDYRTRLGGIASRQALGLDRQMEHLRESVGRIFGDVRIEGFLSGLHTVISLFSQSTITGRALHQLAGVIFSPLFDSVGDGAPTVVNFLQDTVIGIQRVVIAGLRAAVTLHHMQTAFESAQGVKALYNLGTALESLDSVLHVSDAAFASIELTLRALFPTLSGIVDMTRSLAGVFGAGGQPLGVALANGLANGIRASADTVRSAAAELGADAEDSAARELEVHSPSRVFARLGTQVARGFAVGVETGTGEATSAVVGMGDAVAATPVQGPSAPASGAQRPAITFGDLHVHVANGSDEEARRGARTLFDELAALLEGASVEMGAA